MFEMKCDRRDRKRFKKKRAPAWMKQGRDGKRIAKEERPRHGRHINTDQV